MTDVTDVTEAEMRKWIDAADYESLLYKARFEPPGSPWFQNGLGDYFMQVLKQKRDADPDAAIQASKNIGKNIGWNL